MEDLEQRVQDLGRLLLAQARDRRPDLWARERWEEALMQKLMGNERFRVQALRFVDVFPMLRDDAALVRHLQEYFRDEELPLPGIARWGMEHARGSITTRLLAGAARTAIQALARHFIGGSDAEEAYRSAETLRERGIATTLDAVGEVTVGESEAHAYQAQYLGLIDALALRMAGWPQAPLLDTVSGRRCPRLNLSVKLSSLYSQFNALAPEKSAEAASERLRPILRRAREQGAFVCLDMEHYQTKHIVLRVLQDILMEPEFRDWPDMGIAIQAYLRDAEANVENLLVWAKQRGTPVTVRLVRGAYWDYETVLARQHGWPIPVWTEKWQTDGCYERCLHLLFAHHPVIETAVATHNVRSLALALALAERHGLSPDQYELQTLYGMADPLKHALVAMGQRVRAYVPFGPLLPGMAYLVRRLLENTASQSFLRLGFVEALPAEALLVPPAAPAPTPVIAERNGATAVTKAAPSLPHQFASSGPLNVFANEPVHRFTDGAERAAFREAIDAVRRELGRDYPMIVGGREVMSGEFIASVNPANAAEIIGRVASATPEHAEAAVRAAEAAFDDWSSLPAAERVDHLRKAAALLRDRRDEFAAWEILEAGKGWAEADADVIEAIDYLDYYAREMLRLAPALRLDVPGETNDYSYRPRGAGVVIAPWNFPLAILTGMLSAAVAAGNTVIVKPSSYTLVVAAKLMEVLREAGIPPGVVNCLAGPGGEIGEYLVSHPSIHFIAFTGSREVGTHLYRLGAEVQAGQSHLKRVIAEMGGKNAIIIDDDADLDDAVLGTVVSAFGYQGQKCSAASRVIVLDGVYDRFLELLADAARSLRVGSPEQPENFLGPVIDGQARDRILRTIAAAREVARPVLEVDVSGLEQGFYVGPAIFADAPPESTLAREEIFGPVLAVLRAADFRQAIALANDSAYALTGGVYSRLPDHLAYARRHFQAGNLYLNRKITGAIVGRQPFGGFKLSGVGSKAGGPDYLLQFLEPRTVTENTLRRGFAPEEALAAELGGL